MFDSRLRDEVRVVRGRLEETCSGRRIGESGAAYFNILQIPHISSSSSCYFKKILQLALIFRELETELLLAAKRASLAYGSTSSGSERSGSQNSSDFS